MILKTITQSSLTVYNCIELNQLSDIDIAEMKKPLTINEVGRALYAMKYNKSPDSDGFPAEFYKYFWTDLKFIVMRMLSSCYVSGVMPSSLHRYNAYTKKWKAKKSNKFLSSHHPLKHEL